MAKNHFGDTPGAVNTLTARVDAVASGAADTVYQGIGVYPGERAVGDVEQVYWTPESDQAGDATNRRVIKLINLGTDATGTTVIASLDLTASHAANVPVALTVVSAAKEVTAGQLLSYVTTKEGNGVAVVLGHVQVDVS